jgi:hypothetical protein
MIYDVVSFDCCCHFCLAYDEFFDDDGDEETDESTCEDVDEERDHWWGPPVYLYVECLCGLEINVLIRVVHSLALFSSQHLS